MNETRLHLYDKEEWWDVTRKLRPDLTREQYEVMWDACQKEKAARATAKVTH